MKVSSKQRVRKEQMLADFKQMCADTDGLIVAEYAGIDVATMAKLRIAVRAAGGQVRVVKNTVAKRVLATDERYAPLTASLRGQLIYGAGTSIAALAKAMRDFAKENEELQFHAGVMAGNLLEVTQIGKLADLPSREELLGMLASTLNAPIAKLARTLAEVPASCARALVAVRDSKASN